MANWDKLKINHQHRSFVKQWVLDRWYLTKTFRNFEMIFSPAMKKELRGCGSRTRARGKFIPASWRHAMNNCSKKDRSAKDKFLIPIDYFFEPPAVKKSSISMLLNDFCCCLVETRRVFDVSHMNCFSFCSKLKQDEIKFSRRHFFLHSSKLAVLRFCKCTKKTDSCYSGNCDCFILPLCTSLTFALSVCESEWVWECVWFSTSFVRLVERCHPLSPSPSLATTLSLSLYLYLQHKLMVRVPSFSLYFLPDRNIFCPHSIAGESQSIFSAPPFFWVFFSAVD